ncbi:MAG TPA: hypothetical protein VNH18_03335, partial [Bryobacteraceae bacterium]|nr:hypothetical protein [Bryobacteraceae bacterium]
RLRPANGTFQFAGEDPLEIDEAPFPAVPDRTRRPPPASRETPVETPASPADTLHVLAALNEIGADVGEPVTISEDAQHQVIVRAMGLNNDRRQQIADALKPLRHVRLEFGTFPSDEPRPASRPAATEKYSTSIPGPLRQQFEERLGSAIAFQEMTDRVLDASASAISRAHALEVLASKFPPATESDLATQDRELLGKLRQRHVSELQRLVTQIRSNLKPLLTTTLNSPTTVTEKRSLSSWQTQVPTLVAAAQELDDSLNRLLAGTYVQASGDAMLRGLAAQLEHLQRVIAQEAGK